MTRKETQSRVVLATVTLLFAVIIVQIGAEWFLLKHALVTNGGTRESAFITELASPGWNILLNDICNMLFSALSDGLLVRSVQYAINYYSILDFCRFGVVTMLGTVPSVPLRSHLSYFSQR